MSSCCLAACGRLAENSQSGEAALTLCGRAPPAHLDPALRGWGGEGGGLRSGILSSAPPLSCAPARECRGSPQPTLCSPSAVPPAHLCPSPSSRWISHSGQPQRPCQSLPCCVAPSPCPGHARYFQPCPSQERCQVGAAAVCRGGQPQAPMSPCHSQVSFPCCAFASPGMAPGALAEVKVGSTELWEHREKDPVPRDLLWMSPHCGIAHQLGECPGVGIVLRAIPAHTEELPAWGLLPHGDPGAIPGISLPWIRAWHLTEEASQGFRWEDENSSDLHPPSLPRQSTVSL